MPRKRATKNKEKETSSSEQEPDNLNQEDYFFICERTFIKKSEKREYTIKQEAGAVPFLTVCFLYFDSKC